MMSMKKREWIVGIVTAVVLCLIAVYAFFDPAETAFPRCPFFVFTGYKCPGCGSQRAIHALLTGDIVTAWHNNAMLLLFAPIAAAMLLSEFFRERVPRLNKALTSTATVVVIVALLFIWMLLRNVYNL